MMTKILILGANGKIARLTRRQLLAQSSAHLTLFLRRAGRITDADTTRETVIEGDATDIASLTAAMQGQDVVYANLAGHNIEAEARAVVAAMQTAKVTRLIWISTLGIYDEVPGKFGEWNHQMLDGGYLETYGAAAQVIEASDLNYTIIRPAWLSNDDIVSYELTGRHDAFKGTTVSRRSVADLVSQIACHPEQYSRASLGVNQPGTDGDKPSFY